MEPFGAHPLESRRYRARNLSDNCTADEPHRLGSKRSLDRDISRTIPESLFSPIGNGIDDAETSMAEGEQLRANEPRSACSKTSAERQGIIRTRSSAPPKAARRSPQTVDGAEAPAPPTMPAIRRAQALTQRPFVSAAGPSPSRAPASARTRPSASSAGSRPGSALAEPTSGPSPKTRARS